MSLSLKKKMHCLNMEIITGKITKIYMLTLTAMNIVKILDNVNISQII